MLRINSIDINGIGPIFKLHLDFNPHFNIICGSNGIGKTTILECIAQTFNYNNYSLRRNFLSDVGCWITSFANEESRENKKTTTIKALRPYEETETYFDYKNEALKLVYYKTNRVLSYIQVDSISKDPTFSDYSFSNQTHEGTPFSEIKRWFINRYLWSTHRDSLCKEQLENLKLAESIFATMASDFSFDKVDPESFDIILDTPKGKIVLEQLSSGYISYIIVLLGIIKDIEYRFKNPHICVRDFDGVLIVDEIDVHLHPELQSKIYLTLCEMLPNAQIFTSTHSPHVIQVAKPDEVIPLVSEKDGNVHVNPIVNKKYGCQGWTIEEILQDVMGMKDTRSALYKEFMDKFNLALQNDDLETAHTVYNELKLMLHPDNVLRKVLEIQLIGG